MNPVWPKYIVIPHVTSLGFRVVTVGQLDNEGRRFAGYELYSNVMWREDRQLINDMDLRAGESRNDMQAQHKSF